MVAVRAGNDELAREALARKQEHDGIAATYLDQWQKQKAAVEQLKRALRMLNDKIEEAKRKKQVLIARKKRADAQRAIQETMSGLRDQSAFETFGRMEEKIVQAEAEAEAMGEIDEQYTGDILASKFRDLEKASSGEDALLALKQKMGVAPPPAAPAPEPAKTRVAGTPGGGGPNQSEADELARALEELESESEAEKKKAAR